MAPRSIILTLILVVAGLLLVLMLGLPYESMDWPANSQAYETPPTSSPTPTATTTATVTLTPTDTATPTMTATATPTPTVTSSPTATPTPTVTSSPTATSTATVGPSPTATATPTSTATPTPTATLAPGVGRITGKVAVQGRTNFQGVQITVDGTPAATTGADGSFEVSGVAPGTHTVRASLPGYLTRQKTDVEVVAGQTTMLSSVQMRGGDADGDGEVGLLDLVLVAIHYDSSPPADPRADINADGWANIFDLVLVASNYRATGPLPWP